MNSSLHRVRLLYQQMIKSGKDAQSGRTYYVNPKTGKTLWELPQFMANRLNYGPRRGEVSATIKNKYKREHTDDDNLTDDSEPEDTQVLIERRRLRRIFPR